MTVSGSVDFNMTRNEIVRDAYKKLGVLAEGESLTAEMLDDGVRDLNRLVKMWQAQGIHLWTYQEGTLFLEQGKEAYVLGPNGDHATTSFVATTLVNDEAPLATVFDVTDASGIANGDSIGIKLDAEQIHWSLVNGAPVGNTVTITTGLPSAATAGNAVYAYTNKIDRPARVRSARRRDSEISDEPVDVPMTHLSRQSYFVSPNKKNQGLPIQFYYDRQIIDGVLFIWNAPSNVSNTIKFTVERPLNDFDTPINTPDFPQEWLQPLVYNLAALLAPNMGIPLEDRRELKTEANSMLELARGFDQEEGSIFFQPANEAQEGWE